MSSHEDNISQRSSRVRRKTKKGQEYEIDFLTKHTKLVAAGICRAADMLDDAVVAKDSVMVESELKRLRQFSNDVETIKQRLAPLGDTITLDSMIQDAETVITNARFKTMSIHDVEMRIAGTDTGLIQVPYSDASSERHTTHQILKASSIASSLPPRGMEMTQAPSSRISDCGVKHIKTKSTKHLEAYSDPSAEGHSSRSVLKLSSMAASLPPPRRESMQAPSSRTSDGSGTPKKFTHTTKTEHVEQISLMAASPPPPIREDSVKFEHLPINEQIQRQHSSEAGASEKSDVKASVIVSTLIPPIHIKKVSISASSKGEDQKNQLNAYRNHPLPLSYSSSPSAYSDPSAAGHTSRLVSKLSSMAASLPPPRRESLRVPSSRTSDRSGTPKKLIHSTKNEHVEQIGLNGDSVNEHLPKTEQIQRKWSGEAGASEKSDAKASVIVNTLIPPVHIKKASRTASSKGEDQKNQADAHIKHLLPSSSSNSPSECESIASSRFRAVSSAHNRLLMQMKILEKVLPTQDEELVKTNVHNVDRALFDLVDSNGRLIEVLIDEENQAHQAGWMEKIDDAVFSLKQQAYTILIQRSNSSLYTTINQKPPIARSTQSVKKKYASSQGSLKSRSSDPSVKQRVKTASLRAEAKLLEKMKDNQIKVEAKRKEEEINDRLAKLQIKIAKSEACEKIYEYDAEQRPYPPIHPNQKSNDQNQHHEIVPIKLLSANHGHIDGASKPDEQFVDIVKLIKAPTIDIDTFTGDPLEFEYFKSNFKEVVEPTVSDQRGRLMRLIKYTAGEAKELIKPCIHRPSDCYEAAMNLLQTEYGNATHITELYIKQLQEWPSVKPNDAAGFKSLYRFLMRCNAYQRDGKLLELNSSGIIRSIISKLHYSYYEKWSIAAEKIQRKECRQPNFNDLLDFVDFHSSRINNPAFSVDILSEARKHQIKSNSTLHKQAPINKKTEERCDNTTAVKCLVCDDMHDIEICATYKMLELSEKIKLLRKLKLCFACLFPISRDHMSRSCVHKRICSTCNRKHPTTLHDPSRETSVPASSAGSVPGTNANSNMITSSALVPLTTTTNLLSNTTAETKISSGSTHHRSDGKHTISLCVIPVFVSHENYPEKEIMVYALLDDGCTGCLGLPSLLEALAPNEIQRAHVAIDTVHGSSNDPDGIALEGLIIRGISNSNEQVHLPKTYNTNSVPAGEEEVPTPEKIRHWVHLKEVHESIPDFINDIPFALIIGSNCPRANEPLQVIQCESGGPRACKTRLGWCVIGPIGIGGKEQKTQIFKCSHIKLEETAASKYIAVKDTPSGEITLDRFHQKTVVSDLFITDKLKEMYDNEFNDHKGDERSNSSEDDTFLDMMDKQVTKEEGHYVLPLPFREPQHPFPNNLPQAKQRLASLKRRLFRDEIFRQCYGKFMDKIISNGYAQQCDNCNDSDLQGQLWYLPHHGVLHKTKKFRGVFDCSVEFHGRSLNGELLQGPDLTNSLCGALIRFRENKIAVMADIESMFYQVRIPKHQRSYQRFLWWPNGDLSKDPVEYEMKVHMFGTISSPSCANYALRKTAVDNREIYGDQVIDTLLKNFYVDDMIKSVDDKSTMVCLVQEVQDVCESGGFNLVKFVSNSREVLKSIPLERHAPHVALQDLTKTLPIERALGVVWCVENDTFGFRISPQDIPLTRRGILSTISSIFDPLGHAAPFMLKGRKILQEITCDGSGWDDPVSDVHAVRWRKWRDELPLLNDIEVRRCYKTSSFNKLQDASIHNFGDACEIGYGSAIYIRLEDTKGNIDVSLVKGKSRVSPINKPVTIPRLELSAAVLTAREGFSVKKELELNISDETYYADSMVTLGYMRNESRRFRLFVANRAKVIRQLTRKEQWQYVASKENPADDASKGISLRDKEKVKRWFQGPSFLQEHNYKTQQEVATLLEEIILTIPDNDPEVKARITVNAVQMGEECHELLSRLEDLVSTWEKMTHIMAIIIAFCHRCKKRETRSTFSLSTSRIKDAEIALLKLIQHRDLEPEIIFLKNKENISLPNKPNKEKRNATKLWKLDPFVDQDMILKVGGRFRKATLDDATKHPVILPKTGLSVKLLIQHMHTRVQHCGRTTTINALRASGYWIIGASSLVRHVISHCVKCRKYRGKLGGQKMADLPDTRTLTVPPFTHCGLDCFGPFTVKVGRKQMKRFVVLYTCMSSRAVHMETTTEMSTDSFILSLRRFLARRGPAESITSDNGKNFIGAENEFKKAFEEMDHERINRFLVSQTCDWIVWKKTPPYASHMGGVWERQIRTVRSILTSLLKEHSSNLDDESFRTLLCEAETIVNSRPLTTESLSDASIEPLTPNHLLTAKCKPVLPPPGIFQKEKSYCRRRWRHIQYLADIFWNRWRKEYLCSLQTRQKWTERKRNFQIGDIVLMKENNIRRQEWPLAKVVETFPDLDGMVRSVNLKVPTATATLKRPIHKIALILENEE